MRTTLSLLAKVRDHYLTGYESALDSYLREYKPSSPEVLFELPRPDSAYAFRLYRADMASNVNGQFNMTEVNTDSHISFEPFDDRSESGLVFRLHPIVWNGVEFDCAGEFADISGLERWGIRWLDIDEVGPKNEIGLLGAIHSLTQPEFGNGRTSFTVDFGSAPLRAFVELLDVLKAMDASDLSISSSATQSMH